MFVARLGVEMPLHIVKTACDFIKKLVEEVMR